MEQKNITQKELLAKINEIRKKRREDFVKQVSAYLEEAQFVVELSRERNKKE